MGRMKGDSTTHVYSKQGAVNHDNIHWNNSGSLCKHRRSIGKGRHICANNVVNRCVEIADCPVGGDCHV